VAAGVDLCFADHAETKRPCFMSINQSRSQVLLDFT